MENVEHASEEIKTGNHHKISQAAGPHQAVCGWSTLLLFLLLLFLFVVVTVVKMLQPDIREPIWLLETYPGWTCVCI